jgi:menaquinone-9 beta-reductase
MSRDEMESEYKRKWLNAFGRRLFAGRVIQSLFGKEWITNKTVGILKHFPHLVSRIIKQTHG